MNIIQMTNTVQEPSSGDKFSHLNNFKSKDPFSDAGNYPQIHYRTSINPIRYKIREFLLPIIRSETPILHKIQQRLRNSFLDYYFAYSANLAAHTFYVLMLPFPIWFGYGQITRDLVYILGYGIYFSGYVKDFCCLPRPRSPPLHRITLSGYTAKEYGFPSSHSANATAVSLFFALKVLQNLDNFSSFAQVVTVLFLLGGYYFTLIIGRIYCGMHGFSDIIVGSLIGGLCYTVRTITTPIWDSIIISNSLFSPFLTIALNYALIYFHVSPVDDCPCYDDSVAFIGVVIGLDISQWLVFNSEFLNASKYDGFNIIDIPYSYKELGLFITVLRVILGVGTVVIWKEISKPLLFQLLKPIYSLFTSKKKFNRARSDTLGRHEKIGDLKQLIKDLTASKKDSVGPESSIDQYELETHELYLDQLENHKEQNVIFTCGAFKKRYDLEIIVRLIVYAGIPFAVAVLFPVFAYIFGVAYVPA